MKGTMPTAMFGMVMSVVSVFRARICCERASEPKNEVQGKRWCLRWLRPSQHTRCYDLLDVKRIWWLLLHVNYNVATRNTSCHFRRVKALEPRLLALRFKRFRSADLGSCYLATRVGR